MTVTVKFLSSLVVFSVISGETITVYSFCFKFVSVFPLESFEQLYVPTAFTLVTETVVSHFPILLQSNSTLVYAVSQV